MKSLTSFKIPYPQGGVLVQRAPGYIWINAGELFIDSGASVDRVLTSVSPFKTINGISLLTMGDLSLYGAVEIGNPSTNYVQLIETTLNPGL